MTRPIRILVSNETLASAQGATVPAEARFAEELRTHTTSEVSLREDSPENDSEGAFLILFDALPSEWMLSLAPTVRRETLARLVLLSCERAPAMLKVLEEYGVAAGVESIRLRTWETHCERDSGYGIAGLRTAVEQLAGRCAPSPLQSDRYCIYTSPSSTTLPQGLAEYLAALSKTQG